MQMQYFVSVKSVSLDLSCCFRDSWKSCSFVKSSISSTNR